jgi:hypothetical protein
MRYSAIDILRCLAIVVMVFVHFLENLSGMVPYVAGIGAPLFMCLSGVSYRLWLNGRERAKIPDDTISRITVRRGLFLFGMGFVFNVAVWLPEDVFNWDVLTLIGMGLLCLNWARRVNLAVVLSACALLFALAPAARLLADWPSFWSENYYDYDWTLTDFVLGFLVVGYFPIFPWLLYPLLGFVVGSALFPAIPQTPVERTAALRKLARWGLGCMSLAAGSLVAVHFWPTLNPSPWNWQWTMFPPSLPYVLGTIGWVLWIVPTAYHYFDEVADGGWRQLKSWCGTISRYSFTIYLWHHVAHLWPLWGYAVWQGLEPTAYWQKATQPLAAGILALIFLVVTAAFLRWWESRRGGGIESWMRWLCD